MPRLSTVLAVTFAAFATGALTTITAPAFAQGEKAAPTATLSIGSPAPKLPVGEWVKGKPVALNDGKVHVVEFWATWCGPCRETIPHLTELAKKYEGKADFTGVSVFERGDGVAEKVKTFVSTMGAKMDYHVARDDASGTIGKTWMEAANQDGIPTAFVVDRTGKIAWIGHPMNGLDEAVGKIVAGTFDAKAEAEAKAKEAAKNAELSRLFTPAMAIAQNRDFPGAVGAMDKTLEANPLYKEDIAPLKANLMMMYDEAAAQTYMAKASGAELKNNAEMLNQLAWSIVGPESKVKKPDYAAALTIAKAAVAASNEKDPLILDTLSYAYEKAGKMKEAIATEEKAISLYPKDSKDEDLAGMMVRLAALKLKK